MQRSQIAGFIPTTEKRLTPHVGRAQWTERSTVQTHKFSFQLGTGVRPPSPGWRWQGCRLGFIEYGLLRNGRSKKSRRQNDAANVQHRLDAGSRNGSGLGGAEEDRTPDLLRARQALSQLSYGPDVD